MWSCDHRRRDWKAFFGRRGTLGNSWLNLASLITAAFERTSSGEIGRQVPSTSHQASRLVKRTAFPSSMPNLMSAGLLCGAGPEAERGFTTVLAVWGFAPSSTESIPGNFCTVFG